MSSISFANPSTRRRGPFQSVPKPAHKPSSSLSSIASSFTGSCASHSRSGSQDTAQDIVARILAQDEIPRGTFLASEAQKKKQTHGKQYPERIDSRRAMLSMFNGSKAPMVFKGPSFGTQDVDTNAAFPCNVPPSTRAIAAAAAPYLLKDLPPTPKLVPSPRPVSPPTKPTLAPVDGTNSPLPSIRPLNLNIKRSPPKPTATGTTTTCTMTLASKRLSRAVRAVPAPIRPPPRLRGFAALNGPSSANTSDEEEVGNAIESQALNVGTTRVPGKEDVPAATIETPFGGLPISAMLDIPVDWDELDDCWTSPVIHPGEMGEERFGLGANEEMASQHFQEEVAGLFASTPKESIAESGEQVEMHSPISSPDSEESMTREKRHGRVLVTKKLKLRMDARSQGASSGPQYGESFLMMYSPLTPCSVELRTSSLLDAYAYVS